MNITNQNYNTSNHYNTSFGKFKGVIRHKNLDICYHRGPYKDFFETHKETMVRSLKTIKESAWFQKLCEKFDDVKLRYHLWEYVDGDNLVDNNFTLHILYRNKNKGLRNFIGRLFDLDWQCKLLSREKSTSPERMAKVLMDDVSNKDENFLSDLEYIDYNTRCVQKFKSKKREIAKRLLERIEEREERLRQIEEHREAMKIAQKRDKALNDEWNKYAQ